MAGTGWRRRRRAVVTIEWKGRCGRKRCRAWASVIREAGLPHPVLGAAGPTPVNRSGGRSVIYSHIVTDGERIPIDVRCRVVGVGTTRRHVGKDRIRAGDVVMWPGDAARYRDCSGRRRWGYWRLKDGLTSGSELAGRARGEYRCWLKGSESKNSLWPSAIRTRVSV